MLTLSYLVLAHPSDQQSRASRYNKIKAENQAHNRLDVCSVAMIAYLCSNLPEAKTCRENIKAVRSFQLCCSHPDEVYTRFPNSYYFGAASVKEACSYLYQD
jgi:hypothetical protein